MDVNLIRQQKEFKMRAISQPVIEKRKATTPTDVLQKFKKPKRPKQGNQRPVSALHVSSTFPRSLSSSGSNKFSTLAQIVNFMKTRHQIADFYPLTMDEILEECKLDDVVSTSLKKWLEDEALSNNPKIAVTHDPGQKRKFLYKPKYNIRDKKSLQKLLDRYDQRGLGGLLMSDIEESLPQAKKYVKSLANKNIIIIVTRPDKKQVVFYNDRSCEYQVDEEFQKLWRSIPVDSTDEDKIEEYLNQNGITSIQNTSNAQKKAPQKRKPSNRKRRFKRHNDHVAGLKDYSAK